MVNKLCRKLKNIFNRIQEESFEVTYHYHKMNKARAFLLAFFRMLWITFKGVHDDMIMMRASALTYITLVSIIPALALIFSIAEGFGASEAINEEVTSLIVDLPESSILAINRVLEFVSHVNFKTLGGIGLLFMVITVIKMLSNIEHSFNDIWGVKEHRTVVRKISDYVSVLVLVPLLILVSLTVSTLLTHSSFEKLMVENLGPIADGVKFAARFSGYAVVIIAFMLLYLWIPNTKVKISAGIAGALVAGSAWKIAFSVIAHLQVGVTKANVIYGTFAVVPLFLFWLYISWVIVLFGAEVSYAIQNWRNFNLGDYEDPLNFRGSLTLAFTLMRDITVNFQNGQTWQPEKFSDANHLDLRKVLSILSALTNAGLLKKINEPERCYLPSKDVHLITASDVFDAIAGSSIMLRPQFMENNHELIAWNEQCFDAFRELLKEKKFTNQLP